MNYTKMLYDNTNLLFPTFSTNTGLFQIIFSQPAAANNDGIVFHTIKISFTSFDNPNVSIPYFI